MTSKEETNESQNQGYETVPKALRDMPMVLIERENKNPMALIRLETDGSTSKGKLNNYMSGRPVESMIGTSIIPNVVEVRIGNNLISMGLPLGSARYKDSISGMKFASYEEAIRHMASLGFEFVVDLGQVSRQIDMGSSSIFRK